MSTASSSSTSQNTIRRNCFFFNLTTSSTLVSITPSSLPFLFLFYLTAPPTVPVGEAFDFSGDPLAKPSPKNCFNILPTASSSRVPRVSFFVTHRQSEVFTKPLKNVTEAHCKFFLWVDDHIVRVREGEATRGSGDGKQNHVEEHLGMDNLIAHIEERIVNLEKLLNKKSIQAELRKKTTEATAREMEASSIKSND
ncbi:hypothetical protein HN873_008790 [Arachis hypogaea]